MKTFLDLQATDLFLDISVSLTPVGRPDIDLTVNGENVHSGILQTSATFCVSCALTNAVRIKIGLRNKQYDFAQETACMVDSLVVDAFDIVPGWVHLARYVNDHDYQEPTNYLGFNGTWSLDIPEPFYRWKHRITGQGMLLTPSKT